MKTRFALGDKVEVSMTGEIVSISKSLVSSEIQYQLMLENEFGTSFMTVPESAIVHPLEPSGRAN